ncbi:cytochrome P450 family protein [Ceratobasidium sp. AG-Ba]|nr:cytochrome P450 family protein [Ceratobasidium sp. AG-Ba]
MDTLVIPVALITGVAVLLYSSYRPRHSVPLPPGPKGHWLFGNALEIGKADAFWRKLAEYSDQYGPIFSVRFPSRTIVVLSDPNLILQLFEKRAANYSDRNELEMMKLTGWNTDIVFLQYGPTLKLYRSMLNRALNNRVAADYVPLQQHEVQRFMLRLIDKPTEFMSHVRLLVSAITVRLAYGYKVDSYQDEFIQTAEKHMQGFADLSKWWGWMVNIFPALKYGPNWPSIIPFRRRAQELIQIMNDNREKPFAYVKSQIAAGTAEDSFTAKLLQTEDGSPVDNEAAEHIKVARCRDALLGGSDTTVSAIQSFFLAMTLYPDAQAKAKLEVISYLEQRSTTNGSRDIILPADRPHLPYTSALLQEVLRWHPVIPVLSHRSSHEDDNHVVSGDKTYRIPARTVVFANVWQVLHDPKVYEHPDRFMPERFLVPNPPPDPETFAFGSGRRSCPGVHIAQQSMWTTISNILANFTITKVKDENGVEITPEELYVNAGISRPQPFQCSITPREGCKEWLELITD